VVSLLLTDPSIRRLGLTCNARGKLATNFQQTAGGRVVSWQEKTNDRSSVMTSSFTNLALAAESLGYMDQPELHTKRCRQLGNIAKQLFETQLEALGRVGALNFKRTVFLGSGRRAGAALEAALKLLEMTAGRVGAISETYRVLRHGPMSYVHADTLVVCFLSPDATVRAYESDLFSRNQSEESGHDKSDRWGRCSVGLDA
jgi:tagatose-6-phosphate ketose/aldose isomerase